MTDPAHPALDRLQGALAPATAVEPHPELPVAAVAALLRVGVGGALEVLLIRRADRVGDIWSGHVALPGGRAEEQDESLAATARRETMEEVAIDPAAAGGRLLGALAPLEPRSGRAPRIAVYPFVWTIGDGIEPEPNEEVAHAAWVALDWLASEEARTEYRLQIPGGDELGFPAITIGDDVLWGITHAIMLDLLAAAGY